MYAVTGELPAAHGWRPTETVTAWRPCARRSGEAPSASDAAPAAAMKRRREAPRPGCAIVGSSWVMFSSVVGDSRDRGAVGLVADETPDVLAESLELRQCT